MSRPPTAAECAYFGDRVPIESPANVADLAELVRAAEADGRTIVAAGEGAHPEAGDPPARAPLLVSTERFDQIAKYEPDDFTIGVGAGMRLAALREELLRNRQEIAHDLPIGIQGTVGGFVSRAPYSLRTASAGPLHSLVLGVEGVSGGGRAFHAGGMVVKNVAGYQLHKICVGAAGTLGVLTRVNLRLRPVPAARVVSRARFPEIETAMAFATELRAGRLEPALLVVALPGALDGEVDRDTRVVWCFEGPAARVKWLMAQVPLLPSAAGLAIETREDADGAAWLGALASFEEPRGDRAGGVVRFTFLPAGAAEFGPILTRQPGVSLRVLADLSSGVVVARWNDPADVTIEALHAAGRGFGAFPKLVHLSGADRGRFSRELETDPNAALAARVRAAFDPRGVFARATPDSVLAANGTSR